MKRQFIESMKCVINIDIVNNIMISIYCNNDFAAWKENHRNYVIINVHIMIDLIGECYHPDQSDAKELALAS